MCRICDWVAIVLLAGPPREVLVCRMRGTLAAIDMDARHCTELLHDARVSVARNCEWIEVLSDLRRLGPRQNDWYECLFADMF